MGGKALRHKLVWYNYKVVSQDDEKRKILVRTQIRDQRGDYIDEPGDWFIQPPPEI